MSNKEVKSAIIDELNNLGIIIDNLDEDVDLLSLEIDSITFITFVVALEERFGIQFPDEYLAMEVLNSLNGLANLVNTLLSNK